MNAVIKLGALLPFAVLAASLSGDTMITLMVIWNTVARQGNLLLLGVCLSTFSIVAYVMQRLSRRFADLIRLDPRRTFQWTRALSAAVAIGGYLLYRAFPDLWLLYMLMALFTILGVFAQQSLETVFSSLVVAKSLTSIGASRILQTTIQLGAVIGNAAGGLLLSTAGAAGLLQVLIVAMLLGIWVLKARVFHPVPRPDAPTSRDRVTPDPAGVRSASMAVVLNTCAVVAIGVLTIQLSGYNFAVPVLFQSIKKWSSFSYGVVDACAAVGALLSALPFWGGSRNLRTVAILCIVMGDAILANSALVAEACAAAVLLGWAYNILRIEYRGVIFASMSSMKESAEWVSRLTTTYQFGKSAFPMIFAFIIEHFHERYNTQVLTYVGGTVTVALAVVSFLQYRLSGMQGESALLEKSQP